MVVGWHNMVLKMLFSMGLAALSNMTVRFMVPMAFLMSTAQMALCLRLPGSAIGSTFVSLQQSWDLLHTGLGPGSLRLGLESREGWL